jgi:hypothetical protein
MSDRTQEHTAGGLANDALDSHTPGRVALSVGGGLASLRAGDGKGVAIWPFLPGRSLSENEANARRLVAAWNATEALPLSALEGGTVADMLTELRDAESEARNQLVRLRLCNEADGPAYELWLEKQRRWAAAIAKATGEIAPNTEGPR